MSSDCNYFHSGVKVCAHLSSLSQRQIFVPYVANINLEIIQLIYYRDTVIYYLSSLSM